MRTRPTDRHRAGLMSKDNAEDFKMDRGTQIKSVLGDGLAYSSLQSTEIGAERWTSTRHRGSCIENSRPGAAGSAKGVHPSARAQNTRPPS